MKNKYFSSILFVVLLPLMFFYSCSDENEKSKNEEQISVEQTIVMYYPWSGQTMYKFFNNNIKDFEKAIEANKGLDNKRLIVFIAKNAYDASMFEVCFYDSKCRRDTLKKYKTNNLKYITADGISSTFRDIVGFAPSKKYSLILGSHGLGWLPVNRSVKQIYSMLKQQKKGTCLTRYFGHGFDDNYQTDITTLAAGIKTVGIKMNFILFDVCYMSNIETAFELRDVTDFIIASPAEIMNYGMPYGIIAKDLLNGNFKGVCDGFNFFYSNYEIPCGTLSVIDCRKLDNMAYLMKNINYCYPDINNNVKDVQILDGFSPSIFFDFGDYVRKACKDKVYLREFDMQLEKLVPYKVNTETFYSDYLSFPQPIINFSGITISDPTVNDIAFEAKKYTSWYKATH